MERIVFVCEWYYPKIGGVPNVVKYLAEEMANRNKKVYVVTQLFTKTKALEILNGVEIHRLNIKTNPFHIYLHGRLLLNHLKMLECDVYIFEGTQCITTDSVLSKIEELPGIKILHSHGFPGLILPFFKIKSTLWHTVGNSYNYLFWKYYYNNVLPRYINSFDCAFCLSIVDSSYNYLISHINQKVKILGNAADDIFFNSSENISNVQKYVPIAHRRFFLSVANYVPLKNQIGILDAYIHSGCFSYDMVFIGTKETKYFSEVKMKAIEAMKKYKCNIYTLTGVEREDIPYFMKAAKLYISGSDIEAFSVSLIEAMACGLPFVSTNVGNARLLPGGITVNTLEEMSTSIMQITRNEDLWMKYSNAGTTYAMENCKISEIVEQLLMIIRKLSFSKI